MKIALSFLAGALTWALVIFFFHETQVPRMTKAEAAAFAVRQSTLEGLYLILRHEQETFKGKRTANGCYTLQQRWIQDFVTRYEFTSVELGQSVEELLCHGWIIPADL